MTAPKTDPITRRIALVGHCGPDFSYLRLALRSADPYAQVLEIDDEESLRQNLNAGVDLLLVNRVLDFGFPEETGVDLIRRLHIGYPQLKMMLVSNYADAQTAAIEAGALPGFGKRDLGLPRVVELIRAALAQS
jgi:two-component system, chemotaxis family, chemotaxis protein CheY